MSDVAQVAPEQPSLASVEMLGLYAAAANVIIEYEKIAGAEIYSSSAFHQRMAELLGAVVQVSLVVGALCRENPS